MSVEAMAAAFKTKFSHSAARLVLLSLADHHNRSTGLCCPKIQTIMRDTCLSRRTVFRALDWLEGLPDAEDPKKTFSPVPIIKREPTFDKNGRQTSSSFTLLFLGCQIDTPECEGGTGEGANRGTPLKKTGRRNGKKEKDIPQQAAAPVDVASGTLFPTKSNEGAPVPTFDQFWKAYPKKKGKADAKKLWNMLPDDARRAAFECLPQYLNTDDVKRGAIRDGDRYLKSRTWEDFEIAPEEDERKKVLAVALDLNENVVRRILAYGWNSFEDVRRKAVKVWNAAIDHAKREYGWQPSALAAAA